MMLFGVVFVLMVLAVLAMAVGVLAGRNSLQGSCGGLNTIQGVDCMVCPTPCESEQDKEGQCPHVHMHTHSTNSSLVAVGEERRTNKKIVPLAIGGSPCN